MKCKDCNNETSNRDLICQQCKNYQAMNEAMEDEDYSDNDDDPQEPDYWDCLGCMKTYGRRPMGGMCTSCGSYVEEGHF